MILAQQGCEGTSQQSRYVWVTHRRAAYNVEFETGLMSHLPFCLYGAPTTSAQFEALPFVDMVFLRTCVRGMSWSGIVIVWLRGYIIFFYVKVDVDFCACTPRWWDIDSYILLMTAGGFLMTCLGIITDGMKKARDFPSSVSFAWRSLGHGSKGYSKIRQSKPMSKA